MQEKVVAPHAGLAGGQVEARRQSQAQVRERRVRRHGRRTRDGTRQRRIRVLANDTKTAKRREAAIERVRVHNQRDHVRACSRCRIQTARTRRRPASAAGGWRWTWASPRCGATPSPAAAPPPPRSARAATPAPWEKRLSQDKKK